MGVVAQMSDREEPLSTDPQAGLSESDRLRLASRDRANSSEPNTDLVTPGTSLLAAAKGVPKVAQITDEIATNPRLVSRARALGELAGTVKGWVGGGPLGAAGGAVAGGRAGETLGSVLQRTAQSASPYIRAAEPYAQTLSTLSSPQNLLELAQMAEPGRRDIGFLGMEVNRQKVPGEQPPLLNAAVEKLMQLAAQLPAQARREFYAVLGRSQPDGPAPGSR